MILAVKYGIMYYMENNYVQVKNAGKTYSGGYRSLGYVSFAISKGDISVFLGSPIAGKTTLLAIIAGLEKLSSGSIILDGVDITDYPIKDRDIGLITSDLPFFNHKSVLYNIKYPLIVRNFDEIDINTRLEEIIKTTLLENHLQRLGKTLSRYEKVVCSLARLATISRKLYLIDDIFTGLTNAECNKIANIIASLFKGKTVIIAVSSLHFAKKLNANNIGFLCYNSVADFGRMSEISKLDSTLASFKYIHEDKVVAFPCDINNDGTVTIFDEVVNYNKILTSNVFLDGIIAVPQADISISQSGVFCGAFVSYIDGIITIKAEDELFKLVYKGKIEYVVGEDVFFDFTPSNYNMYDFSSERKISI